MIIRTSITKIDDFREYVFFKPTLYFNPETTYDYDKIISFIDSITNDEFFDYHVFFTNPEEKYLNSIKNVILKYVTQDFELNTNMFYNPETINLLIKDLIDNITIPTDKGSVDLLKKIITDKSNEPNTKREIKENCKFVFHNYDNYHSNLNSLQITSDDYVHLYRWNILVKSIYFSGIFDNLANIHIDPLYELL